MSPAQPPPARRRLLQLALGGAVVAGIGSGVGAAVLMAPDTAAPAGGPSAAQRALTMGGPWLNGPPLRPQDLQGKVVLVNVWTYSCINSIRPLPYLRAWAEAYRSHGLVVAGVHTPEFGFEKDLANVRRATRDLDVGFPVVLDSDYRIWRAFDNEAWPAFYLIDAKGRVRHRVYGEGKYDALERALRALLSEAGASALPASIMAAAGKGVELAPDFASLRSPETYLGAAKASNFASPGGLRAGAPSRYLAPRALPLNHWSLAGLWTVGDEFATLSRGPGQVAFRAQARDLHMVLSPSADGRPVRFKVRLDGAPVGAAHGVDVDAAGFGTVREPRMYQLVRQAGPIAECTVEIEFLDGGLRAYVFTFG